MMDEPRPDKAWEHLADSLRQATCESFPSQAIAVDEKWTKQRHELLDRRRHLRESLQDDDAIYTVQLELTLVSRRLRRLRQRRQEQADQALLLQLWDAWRTRRFADMHKIRCKMSKKGLGIRKRVYYAPRQLAPSPAEWAKAVSLPGTSGGMRAEPRTLAHHKSLVDADIQALDIVPFVNDKNIEQEAREDWHNILWALSHSRRRRSTPVGHLGRISWYGNGSHQNPSAGCSGNTGSWCRETSGDTQLYCQIQYFSQEN